MRDAKKLTAMLLALVAAAALAACGGGGDSTTGTSGEESAAVTGELTAVADAPAAYSKAKGEAELERANGGTTVLLTASGLEPKTAYIAHLHTGGCDQADPGGPHFQFEPGGSEEPPNEIHLEFTTDAAGEGEAEARSKREVPVGEAGSVVLHEAESHETMSTAEADEPESTLVLFVHEGVDHSKEGGHHEDKGGHHGKEPQHAHSDKIACAELEGAAAGDGEPSAAGGDVPTIVVRDGEPVGGVQELEFSAGEEIRFRVTSDEAEEIHVHGYDLAKDVPAGGTVEFAFPAELEGIYEAELEQLGVQIAELQVNP
ncbi:MAG: cupredoxin domain-containing protein [Actinomycetota bacterium]|nr:cupredoxin domain-containing protein [Actinomycetota bacterium]